MKGGNPEENTDRRGKGKRKGGVPLSDEAKANKLAKTTQTKLSSMAHKLEAALWNKGIKLSKERKTVLMEANKQIWDAMASMADANPEAVEAAGQLLKKTAKVLQSE